MTKQQQKPKRVPITPVQMNKLAKLLRYSDRYEISIQFWPEQTAVFIEKDGIELKSYGGDWDFAIDGAIEYLQRINKTSKGT